jgi:hypothetical protein
LNRGEVRYKRGVGVEKRKEKPLPKIDKEIKRGRGKRGGLNITKETI